MQDLLSALKRKAEEDRRKGLIADDAIVWTSFYHVRERDRFFAVWDCLLFQEGLRSLKRGWLVPAVKSFDKAIEMDHEDAMEAYVARANRF